MTTIQRVLFLVPLVASLALGGPACGDDEAPPPTPKKAAGGGGKKSAKKSTKGRRGKKGKALSAYPRIDEKYRRPLSEADFLPDPTGDERRDPFVSYVVRGKGQRNPNAGTPIAATDVCNKNNTKAANYLLRDMRLIGIVLLGTNSYALFRDKSGFGWSVRRGDCVGKEKAIVQAIGVGSVTLEVIPETPPNAPPPPPQRRDIALYPSDLDPTAVIDEGNEQDGLTPLGEGAAPPIE
jgi:hypothetical protein